MTLPTRTYTWEYSLNNPLNGTIYSYDTQHGATTQGYLLWLIKEVMKDSVTFTSPWVVKGSADGAGAGAMDSVDRWVDYTDVLTNSGNHSWIVLEQAGMAGSQFMIDMYNDYPYLNHSAYRKFSTTKFDTGGSPTAAPTSSGVALEMGGQNAYQWVYENDPENMFYVNVAMTTGGECTLVWVMAGNRPYVGFMLMTLKNAHVAHTTPYLCWWPDNWTQNGWEFTWARTIDANHGRSEIGGVASALYLPTHGYSSNHAPELSWAGGFSRSDFTGEFAMWPMHAACETVGQRGWFGQVPDVYYGPSASLLPQGAMTSGKEWVRVGDLWLPWDGSSVPMTS